MTKREPKFPQLDKLGYQDDILLRDLYYSYTRHRMWRSFKHRYNHKPEITDNLAVDEFIKENEE